MKEWNLKFETPIHPAFIPTSTISLKPSVTRPLVYVSRLFRKGLKRLGMKMMKNKEANRTRNRRWACAHLFSFTFFDVCQSTKQTDHRISRTRRWFPTSRASSFIPIHTLSRRQGLFRSNTRSYNRQPPQNTPKDQENRNQTVYIRISFLISHRSQSRSATNVHVVILA